jgi:beta-phosphoglucomutase-like phosphatase (HAD superfamily)
MNRKEPLLIFDCDGVLVDSEALSNRIFVECLQKEGFDIDEAYGWKHFYGITLRDCLTHIEEKFGRKVEDDFVETLSLLTNEEIKKELQPIPYVDVALSELPQPKCVASGSDYERIELSLKVTGLRRYFQRIFSVVDVPRANLFPTCFCVRPVKWALPPDKLHRGGGQRSRHEGGLVCRYESMSVPTGRKSR